MGEQAPCSLTSSDLFKPTTISLLIPNIQTNVGVHALSSTRSPTNFHLPEAFVPDRWLPSATTNPSSPYYNDCRGASQPFSIGPRNCLGKALAYNEMRVLIARVLWNFDVELCDESVGWGAQVTYTLWEKGELMCKLTRAERG